MLPLRLVGRGVVVVPVLPLRLVGRGVVVVPVLPLRLVGRGVVVLAMLVGGRKARLLLTQVSVR